MTRYVPDDNSRHVIFGIRHHGPGSARSLKRALEELQPDIILVEGPPDANDVLPLLAHSDMQPPVALLVYAPNAPQEAAFFPFAVFSPEWQAIHYGLTHELPVRFMDLPQAYQLAASSSDDVKTPPPVIDHNVPPDESASPTPNFRSDPLALIAHAAGYSDGERWWEHMVEERQDSADVFAAILELMTALRIETESVLPAREAQREAYMRQTIRAARREGFSRIAVVCGAWHAPALTELPAERADADLLKGLPKIKVAATWVPWTYGRLTSWSGYGAGITSPAWYHHLWETPNNVIIRWLSRAAQLLRAEDLDASSAHVIEAVRLAEALAAIRGRPLPGLDELCESVQSVFCGGDPTPMHVINEQLIVGNVLGYVPAETPSVPLQQDIEREQKRLRLPPEANDRVLDLDLRKPNDLERSYLLHRLNLLTIPWGQIERVSGKQGTFHELWRLRWRPEFAVDIIEASQWGTTLRPAATARVLNQTEQATELPTLTQLVEQALLADLPDAVAPLMLRLHNLAALTSDIPHLMESVPPLVNISRYGNVRGTDTGLVGQVVDGLIIRICIGLPAACAALNDEAARAMFKRILAVHQAIVLLQNNAQIVAWHHLLETLAGQQGLHSLIAGRACRLLLEREVWDAATVGKHMRLTLSPANAPLDAAAWIEGMLSGSGLVLLHNDTLWAMLDAWLTTLAPDTFIQLLPLLRRTFATFPAPERRQMGERARDGIVQLGDSGMIAPFMTQQAAGVLPTVAMLLGLRLDNSTAMTTENCHNISQGVVT